MARPKIVDREPEDGGRYFASTQHRDLSQRTTLERSLVALAEIAGFKVVDRARIAGGATLYRTGPYAYMSASNLILIVSEGLASSMRQGRARDRKASRDRRLSDTRDAVSGSRRQIVEKRNRRPFGENGLREVSSVEYQMPDGNWTLMFEGVEFIRTRDGTLMQTPSAPVWSSEKEARVWLTGGDHRN